MKERDYILGTNVAKVRMAIHAVSSMLPDGPQDTSDRAAALDALCAWESRLEAEIDAETSPEVDHD